MEKMCYLDQHIDMSGVPSIQNDIYKIEAHACRKGRGFHQRNFQIEMFTSEGKAMEQREKFEVRDRGYLFSSND